jgi:site-specific recombinase XerD
MSKPIQILTPEQLNKLIYVLEPGPPFDRIFANQFRAYAIIVLLADTGLRVSELAQLYRSDLVISGQIVSTLRVRAETTKTKTERIVPLSDRCRNAIELLEKWYWPIPGVIENHRVWIYKNIGGQLSVRQIQRIVSNAGKRILGIKLHPHTLRHTFATRLMQTTNIRIVQQLLGHKCISSTQIYTHPNMDDLTKAINSI